MHAWLQSDAGLYSRLRTAEPCAGQHRGKRHLAVVRGLVGPAALGAGQPRLARAHCEDRQGEEREHMVQTEPREGLAAAAWAEHASGLPRDKFGEHAR